MAESDLRKAKLLIDQERYADALSALDPHTTEFPDDPHGVFLLGHVFLEIDKPLLAYQCFERAAKLDPKRVECWLNLGRAADDLQKWDEADQLFAKCLKMDPNSVAAMSNIASIAVHRCDGHKAEYWARKALEIDPKLASAHLNLGFALLMLGDYSGWEHYEWGLGRMDWREEHIYVGEERWDGTKGRKILIYGEQGMGDQIAMSEAILDARNDARNVILNVNPKLTGLFQRTFDLETHGDISNVNAEWVPDDIEASCAMSTLQKFYRNHRSKYIGERWLKPCPRRVSTTRFLLSSLGDKPKVGIAWTGGIKKTGRDIRSTTLDVLRPLLEQDVTWVSLEYKDRSEEIEAFRQKTGIEIHDFPWLTRTEDYDDTAALVESLDLVISVPQTVVHLAGGLGKECWVMQTDRPHFFFLTAGETPIYKSVRQIRRKGDDWAWQVSKISQELGARYASKNQKTAEVYGHVRQLEKARVSA